MLRSRLQLRGCAITGIAAVLIVFGAGCASRVPDPVALVKLDAPAEWTAAPAPDAAERADRTDIDWIRELGGAPLAQWVVEAWDHNRNLAAAAARVQQAAAQARLAGAERGPRLSAGFSANRSKTVFPNPLGAFPEQPDGGAPQPDLLAIESTQFGLSADASWEADLWGRLGARARAAGATFAAARADLADARLALAGEVARRWFDYVEATQQLALAAQTEETLRAQERIVSRRFDQGRSSALDVRLARTSTLSAAAEVTGLRQQVDGFARALEILLGRYPAGSLPADSDWPAYPPIPDAGLPAELVQRRPDLRAAEARYAASALERGAARKLRYPKLTLSASAGTASSELGDLLDSDFGVWSLAGGLTAPLFNAGRIRAQIDAAEAAEEAALQDFAAALLAAYQEVESSLAAERLLAEREERIAALADESARAEAQAWEQYQRGLVEIPAVLEAQRRDFDSRRQLLAVRGQRRRNRVTLHLGLGGGWIVAAPERASLPLPPVASP